MKKALLLSLILLLAATVNKSEAQLLYSNTSNSGFNQNQGNGTFFPAIMLDDVQIDSSVLTGYDTLDITLLKFGIGRLANAPAVTLNIYCALVSDTSTSVLTAPATPPVFIGTIPLAANGSTSGFVTVKIGDSVNTLFKVPKNTGKPYAGMQTFFVGMSFSNNSSDNGWNIVNPVSANDDRYWVYDSATSNPLDTSWFGGSPHAAFNLEVFGKTRIALPVTFINFGGKFLDNNIVELSWVTTNEINNKGFNIQQSRDGENFRNVGFVNAKSSLAGRNNYSYTLPASVGDNYYRLQQIDKDGRITYSGIVHLVDKNNFVWKIYPNPITERAWLELQLSYNSKVEVNIISRDGKILRAINKGAMTAGSYSIPLPVEDLSKGMYFITLTVDGNNYSKTFIK